MKKRFLGTISLTAMALTLAHTPAFAADDATIAKLTSMIEQQQRELNAMRAELGTIRSENRTLANSVKANTTGLQKTGVAQPVEGAPKPQAVTEPTKTYVEAGDFPNSIKVPGTNVSFKIGGQVKADVAYTFDQTAGLSEDLMQTRTIQTTNAGEEGRTRFNARETRLNLDVRAPTEFGDLRAFTEFDLYGGSSAAFPQQQVNGYELRLRHAWVQLGQFMAGQNWSTFNDPTSFAESLDFAQVNGESFVRQPQVRWTSKKYDGFTFNVAAENPEGDISDNTAPATGRRTNSDQFPDMVANVQFDTDWTHFQLGGLWRKLKVEDTAAPAISEETDGYGVNFSGKIKMPWRDQKDSLRFQANYGEGIGRYINDLQMVGAGATAQAFDAAINPANSDIEALKAFGGYVSYQAVFDDKWRSNLTGGYVDVDQPSYQIGSFMDNTTYASANLIYTPVPKLDLGIEYIWGQREDIDGNSGEANRIMGSARYQF